ncbi:MAG: response regulator [Chloroflexi bacterium]|nr:response regulator [Chloroflexota bacterium]
MLRTAGIETPAGGPSAAPVTRTVLVIEDSEPIRRILALLLEGHGYRVVTAADGTTGLALARELHPDAITLDLRLPGLDGRLVLRELANDPRTHQIPVLVISAYAGTLADSERAHATDILAKPFDVDELLSRVAALVD